MEKIHILFYMYYYFIPSAILWYGNSYLSFTEKEMDKEVKNQHSPDQILIPDRAQLNHNYISLSLLLSLLRSIGNYSV